MVTAVVLVALAAAFRLLAPAFHYWNLVPVGAVALYAGARLPRRWAWAVPVAAMALSDVVIDHGQHRAVFGLTRWTVYGTFAMTAWLGLVARSPKMRGWMLPGLSLVASSLFFVTSNLAVWAEGQLYPMTGAGLIECYIKAIPFHQYTLVCELIGTCLLFGLGPVVERATGRLRARAIVDEPRSVDLSEVA